MNTRKFLNILVSLMVLTTLVFGGSIQATAAPADPLDETKVPHYFGPNPNWANSPFTLPNASVEECALSLLNNAQHFIAKHYPHSLIDNGLNQLWQPSAYAGTCGEISTSLMKTWLSQ